MEASQPVSGKRPYGKIRVVVAILNTLAASLLMLWAAYSLVKFCIILAVKSAPGSSIFYSEFDKVAIIAVAPAAILMSTLPGIVILLGGVMGLARKGRAFHWSALGWLLVCLPLISNYFDYPVNVSDFRLARAMTQTSVLLAIAAVFAVANFLLRRRDTSSAPARPKRRVFATLLLIDLLLVLGGVQVGTWVAIQVFENDEGMSAAEVDAGIPDGVKEYREDWGNMQTVNVALGPYTVAIPVGSSEKTRGTHELGDHSLTVTMTLLYDDLTILVIAHSTDMFGDFVNKEPLVSRVSFSGITESYERYKKTVAASPKDFSFFMSRNRCIALITYLYLKHAVGSIGEPYPDVVHEIRTKFLRGARKPMKTPAIVELFDPSGRRLVVKASTKDRGELTPEQERLLMNIIASIRSRTPADSIAEALSH